MLKRFALAASACCLVSGAALAQNAIKIAHVYDKTGPLEAYAKQTQIGLMMGLEYATGGKMEIGGRKIVVIEKDTQGKPDIGKAQLAAAFGDDKADIAVGPTSSGVALAMLPVAEEYKKILLVEPAVADSITGDKWNRYIFRTGCNSSQDAISNAVALGKKEGTYIATLAQDYAFGKDFVKAFKDALAGSKAKLVFEEYAPQATTDFTLRKQVDVETTCLKCHGQMNTAIMGLPAPWPESKAVFGDSCLTCHAAIRTRRHQVTYLNAAAIEAAGQQNADTCYGCHGGRAWYGMSYPYPRHAWADMPADLPDWAKDRPTQSEARFQLPASARP